MAIFGYQTPNKGNALAADTFRLYGSGLGANRRVNWQVVTSGPVSVSMSGFVNANPQGVLDRTVTDARIQSYYADASMPKISGGEWVGDMTTFNTTAQNGSQTITLSAQLV